jgi:acyl-CoA synthetase (AMP-forming)/AMP-acid ligase II
VPAHLDYPDIPYHALLRHAAERWPNKTALVFGEQRYSYAALNSKATRFAGALQDLGLNKGDRVALFLPNCPEYEIAFFGACRVGAVPTPLNPSYKEREVRYQTNDAGARVLVTHESLLPVVGAARDSLESVETIVVIGKPLWGALAFEDLLSAQSDIYPELSLEADDLAALPYSSGTTGTSKGVMLSQRNLVSNALQFVACTQSSAQDAILIFLPLYHIYGVALMSNAVAAGARQVLMPRFDLAELHRLLIKESVTELFVVPPVMIALAGSPDVDPKAFRSLRFLMSAAAPLAPDVARRVTDRLGVRAIQAYGTTEASPLTHMVAMDDVEAPIDSVGVPAPDTECRIVDLESGTSEMPLGEPGEVVISGPQVMQGYWEAPEETARALRNGWLHTGDVGRVDETGNLYIVDRTKEMIKYKAFSIAPAELEGLLLEHPAVADCAVTGHADEEAGEVPHAFVVLKAEMQVVPGEIQAWAKSRVASYKEIRYLDVVEAIPRTPSGKILRRMLRPTSISPT